MTSAGLIRAIVVLFAMLTATAAAHADVFLRGDVWLRATETYGSYEIVAEVPRGVRPRGRISLPGDCTLDTSASQALDEVRILSWTFACESHLGPGDVVALPLTLDAAAIHIDDGERESVFIVSGPVAFSMGSALADARPLGEVAVDYLEQGAEHIWAGWDHLAFVLCLCFVAAGLRKLALLITAFTVGHSLSMALSFLGVIEVHIPPIEAIIALSIVWMARDALLLKADGSTAEQPSPLRYFVVVTGFGLIHGLGFASALEELGVVEGEKIAALAFFNLGVEFGQLVFVVGVMAVLGVLRRLSADAAAIRAALYVVGCTGSFWMFERLVP